ncbi:hypothetical protein DD237_004996 [Peronospora effusa]|uniref:TFIIS N-terminal domain-containing protein n=1 Tax=Peronospora effusa TaxID=542832 RepID=A0A3R7W8S7_9STRA|nr:hypothetical protein DD237_004996 [Peronospora effusa]
MAHIKTKDPFGFVGSHIVRRQPRTGVEEHGWLTRYDESLDCYTLFVPGTKEEPRLLARGEVLKYLSAPNIEFHDDDEKDFPPPVKDTTTSRYVGVKVCREYLQDKYSRDNKSTIQEKVQGQVKCFLPFADRYIVEYEDGTMEEVSESTVINGMIALIKSFFRLSLDRTQKHKRKINDDDELEFVRRKRQRSTIITGDSRVEEIPSGSIIVIEDVADEQQDDEVVFVDQMKMKADVDKETELTSKSLETRSSTLDCTVRENSLEMASHPAEELMLIGKDDAAGQDDSVKIEKRHDEPDGKKPAIDTTLADTAQPETPKKVPFYIVNTKPHVATKPFPKRAMAFELLRASLINLLDRREASVVKIARQYDLLRNPDMRDRDAVIRFMDADGLFVLNHLLSSFATEVLDDSESKADGVDHSPEKIRERMERDDELLHVLKLVAMLPTPSRNQVVASKIGKTINYLSKPQGPPGRQNALPKCITALAKWIKTSWIKNISPASKSAPKASACTQGITRQLLNRPQQQARRGGHGGSSGHRSLQLNRRQPPPSQRLQRQVSSAPTLPNEDHASQDNIPIPRRPRPRQVAQPQQPVAASALSHLPVSRRVQGSLKPDWIRKKENLSRSRFCIVDNANVDTRLYRSSQAHPITNAMTPSSQAPTQQHKHADQHEDAGGPDGVFGRAQRLRFGKRWSIQEFGSRDPPGTLRQRPGSSYSAPPYGRSQDSDQHLVHVPPVPHSSRQPRPILQRVSRYNDEPAIDGLGR